MGWTRWLRGSRASPPRRERLAGLPPGRASGPAPSVRGGAPASSGSTAHLLWVHCTGGITQGRNDDWTLNRR